MLIGAVFCQASDSMIEHLSKRTTKCQTCLDVPLIWRIKSFFITNTTAYNLGRYGSSSTSTKELHRLNSYYIILLKICSIQIVLLVSLIITVREEFQRGNALVSLPGPLLGTCCWLPFWIRFCPWHQIKAWKTYSLIYSLSDKKQLKMTQTFVWLRRWKINLFWNIIENNYGSSS